MSENDQVMLNPQIANVEIGIRNLRKITVYPLSMADQLKLTDTITQALRDQFQKNANSDIAIIEFVTNLIKDNLGKIISMVTDEADGYALLNEITNFQAVQIAEILYEVNYGVVAKNFKSLFGKLSPLFLSGRPLPPSASDMDTNSKTSIEKHGETEA